MVLLLWLISSITVKLWPTKRYVCDLFIHPTLLFSLVCYVLFVSCVILCSHMLQNFSCRPTPAPFQRADVTCFLLSPTMCEWSGTGVSHWGLPIVTDSVRFQFIPLLIPFNFYGFQRTYFSFIQKNCDFLVGNVIRTLFNNLPDAFADQRLKDFNIMFHCANIRQSPISAC